MKKYIIGFIIILLLIAGCFYLVFSRDENLTITYIRFKVNPEFVIGINNNERVVFYNPLNEDAKIFNLMMFNNKTLDEACEIFIEKMDENNYLVNKKIDLTIITKNLEKERKIVQKIKDSVIKLDSEIEISTVSPTSEELLSYSNETAYGLPVTYDNLVLQTIGKEIKDNIDFYIQNKIKLLNLDKLANDKKIEIIKENYDNGYFNDYDISSYSNYDIIPSKRSNYDVIFSFNDDFTYSYNIILNLEFDLYREELVNELRKGIVEVYKYTYDENNNELISNYKNEFYKFNY